MLPDSCPGELESELTGGIYCHCQATRRTYLWSELLNGTSQQVWSKSGFFLPRLSFWVQVKSSKNVRFNQGWDYAKALQWGGRGVRPLRVTAGIMILMMLMKSTLDQMGGVGMTG